jgi:hypothetical protein
MRRLLFALLLAPLNAVTSHVTSPPSVASPPVIRVPAGAPHERLMSMSPTLHVLVNAAQSRGLTIDQLRAKWQRVAVCEVAGNWAMTGPRYSGIGFLNTTWSHFGGTRFARLAGLATRDEQILVGMRVTHGYIPDQYGCSPTGW